MNQKERKAALTAEIVALVKKHRGRLGPRGLLMWARSHPKSQLHQRFCWNNEKAAEQFRLWQARELLAEVRVTWTDGKERRYLVSPLECRGPAGHYPRLEDVLADPASRKAFLAQALAEYERANERYQDLKELAGVRASVRRAKAAAEQH